MLFMKTTLLIKIQLLSLLFTFNALAQQEEIELIVSDEKLTMKEVKEIASSIPPENSCIDEYLKRRKQLITQLVLKPLSGAAAISSGIIGGFWVGATLGKLDSRYDGWAQLGWAIGGGMLGTVASTSYVIVDTTLESIQLAQIQTITKSLAEIHSNHHLISTKKLYLKLYKTDNVDENELESFSLKLKDLDASGKLCDGSLMPSKRFDWQKRRLKNKVARYKHLRKSV
jgi:hypothetical protein